ncbi:PEGA domain-containing protein [Sorangium sp. So ce1036]|uniref:PEGA domain-containing protein n=1 Tax=Sorangium sp. So ce1036 TaxID=3133328 RepID=UPI003F06A935
MSLPGRQGISRRGRRHHRLCAALAVGGAALAGPATAAAQPAPPAASAAPPAASAAPPAASAAPPAASAAPPAASRLDLQVSEAGATVLVDGEVVGETPLREPVLLDVGTRRIRVTKEGFKDVEVVRQVSGDGVVTVTATLEKEVHRGRLIVTAGPTDVISVDGRVVGRGSYDGPVPSGARALRVTAPGMVPHESEVVISDDQTRRVQVSLVPQAKKGQIENWIWLGGGLLVLTGALLFSLGTFQAPPPVDGNTSPGSVPLSARGGVSIAIPLGGGR